MLHVAYLGLIQCFFAELHIVDIRFGDPPIPCVPFIWTIDYTVRTIHFYSNSDFQVNWKSVRFLASRSKIWAKDGALMPEVLRHDRTILCWILDYTYIWRLKSCWTYFQGNFTHNKSAVSPYSVAYLMNHFHTFIRTWVASFINDMKSTSIIHRKENVQCILHLWHGKFWSLKNV